MWEKIKIGKLNLYKFIDNRGNVRIEFTSLNDEYHGRFRGWFHRDRGISHDMNYKNGKKDGLCRSWNRHGSLEREMYFIDGALVPLDQCQKYIDLFERINYIVAQN